MLNFLVALQFLTTLPVPLWRSATSEDVGRSVRYFPVVGLVLGIILASLNWFFRLWLPPALSDLLLVISLLLLSGALHLDGFLDSCDGLFGYRTTEQRLEIMHDSRVGSFGVAGGFALLSLKYVSLSSIPTDLKTAALLLAPLLGRWALVTSVVLFPYGRESGLGTIYKRYTTKLSLALTSLVIALFTSLILGGPGLLLALLIFGVALLVGKYIMLKLPKGLTGDSYGAIAEIGEMVTWLFLGAAANMIHSLA
ncbi:MAG: adenosylcobinamide-GDP ribazoletransferase [Chloroflexi bacterium]|nr:adenosylcobinamide-GDP ribazoletransferase [Chloroflexota bacterium]